MSQVIARCQNCGKESHVSRTIAGDQIVCWKCKWKFIVPLDAGYSYPSPKESQKTPKAQLQDSEFNPFTFTNAIILVVAVFTVVVIINIIDQPSKPSPPSDDTIERQSASVSPDAWATTFRLIEAYGPALDAPPIPGQKISPRHDSKGRTNTSKERQQFELDQMIRYGRDHPGLFNPNDAESFIDTLFEAERKDQRENR